MEYIVYCDESDGRGSYYSNFYGGALIQSKARMVIRQDQIAEVKSHEHVILQCLDIELGAIQFRLNDKHLEKPLGSKRRAKRTVAKEHVYKRINKSIQSIHPNFNIGITTGTIFLGSRPIFDKYLPGKPYVFNNSYR